MSAPTVCICPDCGFHNAITLEQWPSPLYELPCQSRGCGRIFQIGEHVRPRYHREFWCGVAGAALVPRSRASDDSLTWALA